MSGRQLEQVWSEPPKGTNWAPFLSLLAPGVGIKSSIPGEAFEKTTGTSMAAPHVAGAFALLTQAVPGAGADAILRALQETGRQVYDPRTGGLRSQRRIRIDAVRQWLQSSPFAVVRPNDTSFKAGKTLRVMLTASNPTAAPLDLYVDTLWPDNDTVVFLDGPEPNRFALGRLSSPSDIRPMRRLEPGASINNAVLVIEYTFPVDGITAGIRVPVGTYHVFASLLPPGSKENPILHHVAVEYSP